MSKKPAQPPHALTVTCYSEFHTLVRVHAEGAHELMAIVGPPGVGKTEVVTRAMQKIHGANRWALIKGKHSPLDLYRRLFQYRLHPIVLDDLDGLFTHSDNTAILKCVCDTRLVKRVEWGSSHPSFTKASSCLPTSFESISRICIIANDWGIINKNVTALHDRGVVVVFRPTALEVHAEVAHGGWFDDEEVFDFIGQHLHLLAQPSFRYYLTARGHKRSGMDWRSLILRTIESSADPATVLAARLLADPQFDNMPKPEAAREQAFKALGGGSRATYHRHKKALIEQRGNGNIDDVRQIKLMPPKPDPLAQAIADRRQHLEEMRDSLDDWAEHPPILAKSNPEIVPRFERNSPNDADVIARLQKQLNKAVAREDYTEAAKIRDEIRRLTRD